LGFSTIVRSAATKQIL